LWRPPPIGIIALQKEWRTASSSAAARKGDIMEDLHGYYIEDLKEGMTAAFGKTITDADIGIFAGVSGDTNPVHLNDDFAKTTMFKTRIAHGMLGAGFISAVFGTKMPGPGCIYVSQNLRFKAPVRVGDTMIARVTVKKILAQKKFVEFDTVCTVGDKNVIEGEATLMVPSRG
jgi:3-hydroxybutyryl-CoA dehydratase